MVPGESGSAAMKIQILSPEMASRIAAGEVVERPSSIVKELIENSLDAGAAEISVWVEKSGTSLIRIADDGEGMAPEDLSLAVERHSTSKIREEDDLFRIGTLGFRGEALPSIGSVARMEIVSRPRSSAGGHRLRVNGGRKEELCVAAATPGTTIEIRDVFFNTPARRKFLKSPATELSHVCDVVNRIALAQPSVHFRLFHDGRVMADYVPVKEGKERLQQVFGRTIAKDLLSFSHQRGELKVAGYVSAAPASFPNARYLMTYVNGRYVRDKIVTHAVLHGYESLLMKGQYPAVVLFLRLPLSDVDVNVHPAKLEVRFRRQSDVHEVVAQAVREALRREAKEPSTQAGFSPAMFSEAVMEPALPYGRATVDREALAILPAAFPTLAQMEAIPAGFFSSMNVLGQVLGCYIVCSSARGLALIDQHAAHERVAYESLRRQMAIGDVPRQRLLIPQTVEVTGGESMLLESQRAALERLGFALAPFGPHAYAITTVPALLPEGDYRPMVRQMIAELAEVDQSERLRHHLEERLATIACHSVIRANRALEMAEMRALLSQLDGIDFATQCPHGRPVLLEFSRDELEKMFKRVL
jgi:DNA mismatch repair protein MutL